MCILYEITNFKDLQVEDEEFWESYFDFDEIGLVRQDKMDIRALDYDQRRSYEQKLNTPRSGHVSANIRSN